MPETADFSAAEAFAVDLSELTPLERSYVAAFAAGLTAQASIEQMQQQPAAKK